MRRGIARTPVQQAILSGLVLGGAFIGSPVARAQEVLPPGSAASAPAPAVGGARAGAATPASPSASAPAAGAASSPAAPRPSPVTRAGAPLGAAQQVEITGTRSGLETAERREATAAKIVFGREDLDRHGDASVAEVLRRLPGVTTPSGRGGGGGPRLRGLGGGYTQILIDGQRMPPGFSLDSITPDQVERIEILRAPTAETGARAVAGTISIVLRDGFRRRINEVQLTAQLRDGQLSPGFNASRNDSLDAFSYTANLRAFSARYRDADVPAWTQSEDLSQTPPALLWREDERSRIDARTDHFSVGGRLQWTLGAPARAPREAANAAHAANAAALAEARAAVRAADDAASEAEAPAAEAEAGKATDGGAAASEAADGAEAAPRRAPGLLTLSPRLFYRSGESERATDTLRTDAFGLQTPRFEATESSSRFISGRLDLSWRQDWRPDLRLEALGGIGLSEGRSRFRGPVLSDDSRSREEGANLTLKAARSWGTAPAGSPRSDRHSFVSGVELETQKRTEDRQSLGDVNGVASELLADFGSTLNARSQRLAVFAQDEWAVNPQWALHLGARWERIDTRGDPGSALAASAVTHRSSVFTPLAHAVWKPDPKSRDQIRLSLTRSYKSPELRSLIARPSLASRYPLGGPNVATQPDRAGNPALKPELATGIDLAFERYLSAGGVLSANLFVRRIEDVMRTVVALETPSWSPGVARYVARPRNIGTALSTGIELDARFRLDQWIEGALPVELRGNLAAYRSRVDGIPGPDNRLAEQPEISLNLGADYRLRGLPLTVGGNLNWVSGYRTQLSATEWIERSERRVVDVFALWRVSPTLGLRLSANNAVPVDGWVRSGVATGSLLETRETVDRSRLEWQLRLEMKL